MIALYLVDKTCSLGVEFQVLHQMQQRNHLDISCRYRPRNLHRQSKILLRKKSAHVQEKRTTTALDRWFKIPNVILDFIIIYLLRKYGFKFVKNTFSQGCIKYKTINFVNVIS